MKHLLSKLLQTVVRQVVIDKIETIDAGDKIITIKNVSITDPFFNGTFDHQPLPRQGVIDAHIQSGLLLQLMIII